MKKAKNFKKSFLAGTSLLFVAVIAVVIIFLVMAFNLSKDKEERMKEDTYYFILSDDFAGQDVAIWMNDSLIADHPSVGDTIIHHRIADETSLFIVDHASDKASLITVPTKKGTFILRRPTTDE